MPEQALIRYNDTLEYEYVTCFSTYGVFTSARIDHSSLPQGFCAYFMTVDGDGVVDQIRTARSTDPEQEIFGTFICKKEIPGSGRKSGIRMDYAADMSIHSDEIFDFEEFFGTHPSIDCQIENAYRKQELQIMDAKEMKKKKGRNQKEQQQERDR